MWRSSSGSCCVTPSAIPVGRIVTLWSGSANSSTYAHTACPPSWKATISFSSSDSASDSRRRPINTRSRAASKSSLCTSCTPRRTANSAASLTRLERSAPLMPGVALAADGVDLVDEDDRGRLLARGLEEVADARRADADEHLHEVGAGDRDERHPRLTGDRTRDEGLAGAGRADQQHTLRDARADLLELARHLEEVDDFGDLFLYRAVARDVGEGRLRFVGVVDLGARAPDVHHRAHLALRASRDEPPERADQRDHEDEAQDRADEVRRLRLVVDVDVRLLELGEVGVGDAVGLRGGGERRLAVDGRRALLERAGDVPARGLVVDAGDVALVG